MKLIPLIIIITILFLSSCSESYDVTLMQNGEANIICYSTTQKIDSIKKSYPSKEVIQADIDSMCASLKKDYNSLAIKDFTCSINEETGVKTSFTIKNIDSLGKYLSPFLGEIIKFRKGNNFLIVDAGEGNSKVEEDITGFTSIFKFSLKIKLPSKIKKIKSESKLEHSYSNNIFFLSSNYGDLKYNGNKNKITIYF